MKVVLKFKECSIKLNEARLLSDGEDFYEMLDKHSPNMLISYLNDRYNMGIPTLPGKRKEVSHG